MMLVPFNYLVFLEVLNINNNDIASRGGVALASELHSLTNRQELDQSTNNIAIGPNGATNHITSPHK